MHVFHCVSASGFGGQIGQVRITHVCPLIPAEHGVDSFCQLSTTALVNTAGIDPRVSNAFFRCYSARHAYLRVTLHARKYPSSLGIICVGHLLVFPCMRQYRILGDVPTYEILEISRSGIDEPHVKPRQVGMIARQKWIGKMTAGSG
jgi:hypothetical protein